MAEEEQVVVAVEAGDYPSDDNTEDSHKAAYWAGPKIPFDHHEAAEEVPTNPDNDFPNSHSDRQVVGEDPKIPAVGSTIHVANQNTEQEQVVQHWYTEADCGINCDLVASNCHRAGPSSHEEEAGIHIQA